MSLTMEQLAQGYQLASSPSGYKIADLQKAWANLEDIEKQCTVRIRTALTIKVIFGLLWPP